MGRPLDFSHGILQACQSVSCKDLISASTQILVSSLSIPALSSGVPPLLCPAHRSADDPEHDSVVVDGEEVLWPCGEPHLS